MPLLFGQCLLLSCVELLAHTDTERDKDRDSFVDTIFTHSLSLSVYIWYTDTDYYI